MQMKGFLLGMVCGAAVTLAVTRWSGQEAVEGPMTDRALARSVEPPEVSDSSQPPLAPSSHVQSSPPSATSAATTTQRSSDGTAIISTPQASIPAEVPMVGSSTPTATSVRTSDATTTPAAVAPLFSEVFKEPPGGIAVQPAAQIHRKLEAEPEDDAWSPYMETNLRNYLQQRPGFDRIEVFVIECRTTICEIQAAGFSTDIRPGMPATPQPYDVFADAMSDIQKHPWGAELTNVGTLFTSRDDRALFVAHFTRNR